MWKQSLIHGHSTANGDSKQAGSAWLTPSHGTVSSHRGGRVLTRSLFSHCLDVAVSKAKRRYGDRASPTFLFPGTGKAMALSLGQHKVKPQCSGNKGRRRGKINVTCLLSHAECRCQNYTYESREGPRGMGTRKDVGEVAMISCGKCHYETYCFL